MKLTAFILIFFGLHVSAKTASQSVTLSGTNLTMEAVFAVVEKQTGYIALFNEGSIKEARPVSIHAVNQSLESFLMEVFKDQPLQFTIINTSIFVNRKKKGLAETATLLPQLREDSVPIIRITGTIMDFNGQVLAGATIRVKGKKDATTSNNQGAFEISLESGRTLVLSYAGYVTAEEKVSSSGNIIVKLEANSMLEEAVIYNGYQKIQQKYLTGSVTSLRMDSIMQPGLNTVDKMLEGRVPGMMYMQNSGQAGAAPKLRIRGTSTILGTREPLWVVDGIIRTDPIPIPADRLNDPDFVNLLGNAISGLNPYDIEQIDVLKDATAAALYGVRAANGVIVITTKRGKPGPPVLNYNATSSFIQRPRYSDHSVYMMNAQERVDVSREMINKEMILRGGGREAYESAIIDYNAGLIDFETFQNKVARAETVNTDWLGNTMRDVLATHHTLSISGGSVAASYRASVGYQSEPGVIRKEKNDRYTGSVNLLLNYKKIKADINLQINKGNRRYVPNEIGILNYAYGTSRTIPLYNEDGSLYYYSSISSTSGSFENDLKKLNILNEINNTAETVEQNEYTASANFIYEIAKGIQFNTMLAYTSGNASHQTWFDENTEWVAAVRNGAYNTITQAYDENSDPLPFGGEFRLQTVRRQNYTINGRVDYSKFLDRRNKHQLTGAAGVDLFSIRNATMSQTIRGYYPNRGQSFANIDFTRYTGYGTWLNINGPASNMVNLQNSLRTFVTSTYVWNDRYIITGTASQEFSNAFGSRSNERFLPTWAISGRWNMQDDVFKEVNWVDFAALRASYGTQGNMLSGQSPYTIMQKEAFNTQYNGYASTIINFPNPELNWEKKHDYNASLEFSVLNGRIRGALGYFYSKTTNAFLQKKVSVLHGAPGNSYVVNGGIIENQGVELDLNFRIINSVATGNSRGFMWRFDPQLGQVFNKLINNNLNSRNVLVDMATVTYRDFLNGNVPVNGKSINTFYSYQFKGLDPNYGYPIFYGAELDNKIALAEQYNKLTKEEVYELVMKESGRREPVLQGGIGNSFAYRNWSLHINVAYSVGNKIRLLQIASGNYGTFRPSSQQNLRKEFVNRWRYPGDELITNIPAVQGAFNGVLTVEERDKLSWWSANVMDQSRAFAVDYYQMYDHSDLRVVKGDYLKLQSASLSYMFSKELCSKWKIKGATINLTGSNLFTIADRALRGQDPSQSGSAPNINLSIRPIYAFNINLSL